MHSLAYTTHFLCMKHMQSTRELALETPGVAWVKSPGFDDSLASEVNRRKPLYAALFAMIRLGTTRFESTLAVSICADTGYCSRKLCFPAGFVV